MILSLKPLVREAKISPTGGSVDHRTAAILSNGSNWTKVPNGAVLLVPE